MTGHAMRARRALVALLVTVLVYGSAPTELWATGVEGIAEMAQANTPGEADGPESAATGGAPAVAGAADAEAGATNAEGAAPDAHAVQAGTPDASTDVPAAQAPGERTSSQGDRAGGAPDVAAAQAPAAATAPGAAAAASPDDAARLEAAVAALAADGYGGYRPNPVFGKDDNLNEMLRARLAALGFADVQTQVVASGFDASARDPKMVGDVDVAEGEANGAITYFFLAPEDKTVTYDYGVLRRFTPTYRLTVGMASADYTPTRSSQLAWDDDAVRAYLAQAASEVAMPEQLVAGEVPEDVAAIDVPVQVARGASGAKAAEISWESSNRSSAKVQQGFDADYRPRCSVAFTHQAIPDTATLTATFSLFVPGYGNAPTTTYTRSYPLANAPRSSATQAQIERQLTRQLAKATVLDAATAQPVNPAALDADVQLSRPRDLGLDGKYYKLTYSSSREDVVRINGYRGIVTRRLEGEEPASATITAHLGYEGVSVSRELGVFAPTVATDAELAEALAFMSQVKDAYGTALLGQGVAADAVEGDLHPFTSASPDAGGGIVWATTAADAVETGVRPVDLPGFDPMGSQPWRTFRSSREDVVASESLRVTRPAYHASATIDSALTYKRYESLAQAHPDDARLAQLVNQPVSATVTVRGTTGQGQPDAGRTLTVSARVVGATEKDADGARAPQDWVPLTEVEVPADAGLVAWDVLRDLLDAGGYTYEVNAAGPVTITASDGRALDSDFNEPYRYWAFYVDGAYGQGPEGSAMTCPVRDGMSVELRYIDDGALQRPSGSVEVNPDASHPDIGAVWSGFGNGGSGAVSTAPTPGEGAVQAWNLGLLTPGEQAAGASASASDPILAGGKVYLVTGSTVFGPAPTFTPQRSLARLQVIDQVSGAAEREVRLGAAMDTTCRPIYADGIIVIPLAGGAVQAVSAATCETIWFVPASSSAQALCTLTVHDGYVYVAGLESLGVDGLAAAGGVARYNLYTGARAGAVASDASGYYWAGGVMVGGRYVIGDDAGVLHVFEADLSHEVATCTLAGGPLRSTLTASDGFVYAVTRDNGTLHKLAIEADGTVRECAAVPFAAYSTSSPTLCGDYAVVGGATGAGWDAAGVLAIIDLSTMRVERITRADGAALPGEVKGTPLVVADGRDGLRAYFTCNGAMGMYPSYSSGGGIYMAELGDAEAHVVFQPGEGLANFCIASIACDAQGNLYYTNDSGHLFKVGASGEGPHEGPQEEPQEESGDQDAPDGRPDEEPAVPQVDPVVPGDAVPGGAQGVPAGAPAAPAAQGSAASAARAPQTLAARAQAPQSMPEGQRERAAADGDAERAVTGTARLHEERRISWWAVAGACAAALVLAACGVAAFGNRRRSR